MSTVKNIILLVALLAAGIAGYAVGARSGQDAKDALAKLEAETKAGEAERKKTEAELNSKVGALSADYEAQKKQIADDYANQRAKLLAQVSARQKVIDDLKTQRAGEQHEIEQLRSHLNDAQSPQERQAKLDRIAQLESERRAARTALRGEECLSVPVPKEILTTLKEGQS